MYTEELRQEGYRRIRRSKELKAQMAGISPTDMGKKFRIDYRSVLALRDGKPVNIRNLTERQKQYIIDCTQKHQALSAEYETFEDISVSMGVSRRCVTVWAGKIGLGGRKNNKREIGPSMKDSAITPELAFLTMRLPCSVLGSPGYY